MERKYVYNYSFTESNSNTLTAGLTGQNYELSFQLIRCPYTQNFNKHSATRC